MKLLYAILHKPTGFYLPEITGAYGRGGSHKEPEDCGADKPNPRLFKTERSAKAALAQWLRGKHMCSRGYSSPGIDEVHGEYYEETEVVHQPHRKREDMEIVPFRLVINVS